MSDKARISQIRLGEMRVGEMRVGDNKWGGGVKIVWAELQLQHPSPISLVCCLNDFFA